MNTEDTTIRIRPLNPEMPAEVALVAEQMKLTLMEVLGESRGAALYTPESLIARVRWHLDESVCVGAVFVAENIELGVVGHIIVRREADVPESYGLVASTYVLPEAQNAGVGALLLHRAEAWMRNLGLPHALTATSVNNTSLLTLFEAHGFHELDQHGELIRLKKPLPL